MFYAESIRVTKDQALLSRKKRKEKTKGQAQAQAQAIIFQNLIFTLQKPMMSSQLVVNVGKLFKKIVWA